MKKLFLLSLLMLSAFSMFAQTTAEQRKEQKNAEYRDQIGIDLSVPDYDVKKPDAKVMGWRLAKILQSLEKNYNQAVNNQMLTSIRAEQIDDNRVRYIPIDKIKILRITKNGDEITIIINTLSKNDNIGKVDFNLNLKFNKGVSDSDLVNSFFSNMGRYIKEDE